MGTRALIRILDCHGNMICNIYTRYDGDPEGVPYEIAQFLVDKRLGDFWSGVGGYEGLEELAVELIAFLSQRCKIYLLSDKEVYEVDHIDFEYDIYPEENYCRRRYNPQNTPICKEGYNIKIRARVGKHVLFDGTVQEYLQKFKPE